MPSFDPAAFAATLALIGAVIIVAAAISGVIDRIGVPQVALFLALGALLGPHAFGLIDFTIDSPTIGIVATLSLVLVLFSDALSIDTVGLRRHIRLALVVLGPGTLVSSALIAATAWWLLDLPPAAAAILGAALASTDPVMMRALLRRRGIPMEARSALGIESGLNDIVLLPIVLVAMAFLAPEGSIRGAGPGRVLLDVFLLGPAAGALVAFVAVIILDRMRRRFGMRRDYESLYVLGVAFTAYAAAEAVHGSGFMAAFTAGLTVTFLDVELCDCFHDYGEATSEMFLLFAFVAFGASLIWSGLEVINLDVVLFAAVALMARTVVLHLTLPRHSLEPASRTLIVWFGPRALSSLLLVLLPVFAGLPGSEALFPLCALVVLASVVFHGALRWFLTRRLVPAPSAAVEAVPIAPSLRAAAPKVVVAAGDAPAIVHAPGADAVPAAVGAASGDGIVADRDLITIDEMRQLEEQGAPLFILDVRTERAYGDSETRARRALRVPPDAAAEIAATRALPRHGWLIAYCS